MEWKKIEDETPNEGDMILCQGAEGGIFFIRKVETRQKNGKTFVFDGATWRGLHKWLLVVKD